MPELTRRRSLDAPDECWHVFYGDVRVGVIAIRTGMPPGEDPWGWNCGFYPGSHPRECTDGTAATFDQARAEFEKAWRVFLSNRTEADFQEWRDQRDWTAEKYRRFDRGERMPPDWKTAAARLSASEGRTRGRGVAGRNGSVDPGRDVGRPDDVRADWRHEGLEPPR